MRTMLSLVVLASAVLITLPVSAAEKTVTLEVDGMTCISCPYMVKSALSKVEGVSAIEVSLETRKAIVTFDDAVTDVAALTDATFDAGFASELIPDE